MKRSLSTLLSLLAVALLLPPSARAADAPALRQRTNFDADWLFRHGDPDDVHGDSLAYPKIKDAVLASSQGFLAKDALPALAVPESLAYLDHGDVACTAPLYDDHAWQGLDLPHDWAITGPFEQKLPGETGKLPWPGIGWYRKHFTLPANPPKGRQTFLDFDGAMAYAVVWCNGRFVGGWPYGYASFRLDLTPYLKTDGTENVLAVRLENPPESSRWYPGSGIYRHVWLVQTSAVHVAYWGTMVKTPEITAERAEVRVQVTVENDSDRPADVAVASELFEGDEQGRPTGPPVGHLGTFKFQVGPRGQHGAPVEDGAFIAHPKLWDLTHPDRYVAVTTVSQDGEPVDRYETPFGIRTIQFTADHGFLLNGERVQLQGVCDHHDLGALGSALNDTALRRQLTILKSMGCNAIRTSHNPPSPELLDLCDRLGFLVMDEAFDCWKKGKKPNDYHLLWADWHEKDLRALVRRDRNHPSVILWSIGNEVPDQSTPDGSALAAELTKIAHDEDGGDALSRRTTAACDRTESGFNDFHEGLDVMGFNYKPTVYNRFR